MLLRVIAAIPLAQFIQGTAAMPSFPAASLRLLAAICSCNLLFGLWTPVAASLMAISEISLSFLSGSAWSMHTLMAALGASIAMTGPGAWSFDARLFGRKRIRIPKK